MNRKYLLRGIGIGLCIGVAVSYTAFKTGNYVSGNESGTSTEQTTDPGTKSSEEQAKKEEEAKKASEEAARKEEEAKKASEEAARKEEEAKKASEEQAKKEEEEKKKAEEEQKKKEEEEKKKAEEEQKKKEEEEKKKAEEEEKKRKEEEAKQGESVDVTVTRGMTSEKISRLLQDSGIIDDAKDFDKWLKKNNYSNKLHVGTFTLKKGMSYEDITKKLTTEGY